VFSIIIHKKLCFARKILHKITFNFLFNFHYIIKKEKNRLTIKVNQYKLVLTFKSGEIK